MSDSCVELVTFEQLLRRYPQLEQHRIAPTGGAFCRAERLKGGGAAGTYAMPRPMAPTGDKHFFGFYLTDAAELLAPAPYDGLYRHYVEAQIHYANGELERYNNAMALWNNGLMTLRDYWCREHLPRRQVQALRLC